MAKDAVQAVVVPSSGRCDEWHLDLGNSFRYLSFHFGAWRCQPGEVIASSLFRTRFISIGAVSHAMWRRGIDLQSG
jgi:hypothetical protein